MNKQSSDIDIILEDLSDALNSLSDSIDNPRKVRQNFCTFVNLGGKLTSYMRRTEENKNNKILAEFPGWNENSNFFNNLRNVSEHEKLITLRINYTWTAKKLGKNSDVKIQIRGHWESDNPLDEFPYDALEFINPQTGEKIEEKEVSYEYDLMPLPELDNWGKKAEEQLEKIGHRDIHRLSDDYFDTLKSFVDWFKEKSNGG